MSPRSAINIDELEKMARRRLPRVVYDFLSGGAEDEETLKANRAAFRKYSFKPRVLAGGKVDLSVSLFGQRYSAPFMIGPTGLNGLYWSEGDVLLAKAAAEAGIGFTLSTASNSSLETVAQHSTGSMWFQLYPWGTAEFSDRLIARAEAAGYASIVLTVDSLIGGKRERDLRHGFAHEIRLSPRVVFDGLTHPRWLCSVWLGKGMPRFENLAEFLPDGASAHDLAEFTRSQRNPLFSWTDVAKVRARWKGPFILKGIMCVEDARLAKQAGVDGIVISNHGGRQLDGAPATLEVLPAIAAALGGTLPILIDGGFRRGSDVVKALALGASAVLLGRATLFGLASGGQDGVAKAIAILREEAARVMELIGCPSIQHLTGECLMPCG